MAYIKVKPIKPSIIRKAGKYFTRKGKEAKKYLILVREARDIVRKMANEKGGEYKIDEAYLKRLFYSSKNVLELGTKSRIREDILKHSTYTGKRSGGVEVNALKLKEAEKNLRNYNKAVRMYNSYWADEIKAGSRQGVKEKKLNINGKFTKEDADARLNLLVDEYKSFAYNTTLKHDRLVESVAKAIEKTAPKGLAEEIIDFFTPYLNALPRHMSYLDGKEFIEYSYEFQMNGYDRLAETLGCRAEWLQYKAENGL